MIEISGYRMYYHPERHEGSIEIELETGRTLSVPVKSSTDFLAVALMLQAETARIDPHTGNIVVIKK